MTILNISKMKTIQQYLNELKDIHSKGDYITLENFVKEWLKLGSKIVQSNYIQIDPVIVKADWNDIDFNHLNIEKVKISINQISFYQDENELIFMGEDTKYNDTYKSRHSFMSSDNEGNLEMYDNFDFYNKLDFNDLYLVARNMVKSLDMSTI